MRITLISRLPVPLENLILAIVITSSMFYGFVKMPPDLDQHEEMLWVYAKGKVATGLSSWGGYLGIGHQATMYRSLVSYLGEPVNDNRSLHTGINITDTEWNGVPVRIYQPRTIVRNGPAVMMYHGGLWVMGSVDSHDHICKQLARSLEVIVVSVDYRLAPENPYPAPLDDCYHATVYMLENGQKLFRIDPHKVALLGVDSGGNLAASVALRLRDQAPNLPSPEYQVLINPILQPIDFLTPSCLQNQYDAAFPKSLVINAWLWYGLGVNSYDGNYVTAMGKNHHTSASAKKSKMASCVDHKLIHRKYLHDSYTPGQVDIGDVKIWKDLEKIFTDPYFAPLLAADLKGLPSAYIVASQYDVVRDDAVMYARRLEKAGLSVTLKHYESAIHSHLMNSKTLMGKQILNDVIYFLLRNL